MSKIVNALIGHALGDAMGTPMEFFSRKYLQENKVKEMLGDIGQHKEPVGSWSDDTSMELATIDSIINKKMNSDKKITKYQNEIIKATGVYTKYPKEVIIGGILIIKNNREIYFFDEAYNKDLEKFYSSHLIKWEIIKKYLNEGYKIFNLGSIKSIDKKDGNYTFKMGFGAKVYEYIGTYDLIINRYLYYFAKFIVKINEMIKRITKK